MIRSSRQIYRRFRAARRPDPTRPGGGDPPGRRRRYLRHYYQWLRPYRLALLGIFALAVVATAFSLVLPLATRFAVDHILLASRDLSALNVFGLGMVGVILAWQGIEIGRQWWMAVLNVKVIHRLRQRLYVHFLHLPLDELGELKTGGIVSRLSGDCDQVTGLLQMALITPGVALLRIVLTLALLFAISWQMAVAALLFLPPIAALNLLWVRRIRPIYRALRRDRAEIDSRVVETFGGIRTVRAFGREKTEARAFAVGHHTVIRKRLLARAYEIVAVSGWGFLIPVSSVVIIWYGGYLIIRSDLTLGDMMAFQMFVVMLLQPVSQIVNSWGQTQQGLAAMERVFDVLEKVVDKPDPPDAVAAPPRVEGIVFDRVTFGYRPGRPVLEDVSLVVPAGHTVALVGPSGSGKTTLTNLAARFYDPSDGTIRLNGIDLRHIRLKDYRKLLALVQQDVFLFDGTVRENIAFGRPGAPAAAIEESARRANAHGFIELFPEGYDTLVGERGVKLSGGQAQRISIARALLADPQILILDEATSSLDSESEALIQAAIADLIRSRTTFIIAHRLSTITHADLIAVFEDGRIVETGTHESLLALRGTYHRMVTRQVRAMGEDLLLG
jgi:ATP-binding cassette subfamily B protein